jgi:hypothetical protein
MKTFTHPRPLYGNYLTVFYTFYKLDGESYIILIKILRNIYLMNTKSF